ncbi:MAG: class II glutamine amidotransferase [bacterium]|nr:class II glutamine amidotransferase [bacterium]
MCRFTLYAGPALRLAELLLDPQHSLIHQSRSSEERAEPTNGDGFGVAWFPREDTRPARYRSVRPAWGDANLRSLARVVSSGCILAHVRAATQGHSAGEANCHPFVHGGYAFMHNGDLGGVRGVRRELLAGLSDAAFDAIDGRRRQLRAALGRGELGRGATQTRHLRQGRGGPRDFRPERRWQSLGGILTTRISGHGLRPRPVSLRRSRSTRARVLRA